MARDGDLQDPKSAKEAQLGTTAWLGPREKPEQSRMLSLHDLLLKSDRN